VNRSRTARSMLTALVAASAMTLAACGGSESADIATTSTPTPPGTSAPAASPDTSGSGERPTTATGQGSASDAPAGTESGTPSGSSTASGPEPTGDVSVWAGVTGDAVNAVFKQSATDFNAAHPGVKVELSQYNANDLKTKTQVALGAGQGPDIFNGYGGGILRAYVEAGHVAPLDADIPHLSDYFLPSALANVTFDGKIYAIPMRGTQPVTFFYNKEIFDKVGLTKPPTTWTELLDAIDKLKAAGYTPISLAGGDKWPYLMWESYLVDRIGGADAFNKILEGDSAAWNDPAVVKANEMIQELIDRGAFGTTYVSTASLTGGASALVYTGKAGMELMGAWAYGTYSGKAPDFVAAGKLGWFPFPALEDGKGDPSNLVGNVAQYYSVNAASPNKSAAMAYLKEEMMSDAYVENLLKAGEVPPIKGIDKEVDAAGGSGFTKYVYELTSSAANYQMSWDQALPPGPAAAVLENLDQLFVKAITPKQFSERMAAAK
jgi:raffinose/stachyose/melibiose transport system substrate-binding protein